MKTISLWQPWATLIALKVKTIETRSWRTSYRGPLAIHATKFMPRAARKFAYSNPVGRFLNDAGIFLGGDCAALPRGCVVATCMLVDVVPTAELHSPTADEPDRMWDKRAMSIPFVSWSITDNLPYGDFTLGRYAWLLADIEAVDPPIPVRGRQQLWEWTAGDGGSGRDG